MDAAAILESQAFGEYKAQGDPPMAPARPSGATSETPGQIVGVQLDAATPAGHAMQHASHKDESDAVPDDRQNAKAIVSDWIDKTFLPAINAQVSPALSDSADNCQKPFARSKDVTCVIE